MQIEIKGNTPSKKNSRITLATKFGKIINIPSNKYREWHTNASSQIKTHLEGAKKDLGDIFPVKTVKALSMKFYPDSKRVFDLTNKAESIMDLLVDNKILEDDNYTVVPVVVCTIGELDKDNPRVTIDIIL